MISGYDGDALLSELEALSDSQRVAFAAACAEALLTYFGSGSTASAAMGAAKCAPAVAFCWGSIESSGSPEAVDPFLAELEEILSEDEEGELGVMEHVIAGAYYALECSKAGDAGQAELVAKNLYEAADYLVLEDSGIDLADPNSGREILASDLMQRTLSGIAHIRDLVAARTFRGDDRPVEISQVREFVGRGLGG
ncbi:hypothetical protein [Streptomyces fulvoviolaceus]|uniref:hypothetical protein n=1 Tax=Streptomyces fulvoviolaceus TaxID=285535 RepID=UPI0004C8B33E|nr:hypothetical protein [Streptomyces fulvoviolaceus]